MDSQEYTTQDFHDPFLDGKDFANEALTLSFPYLSF